MIVGLNYIQYSGWYCLWLGAAYMVGHIGSEVLFQNCIDMFYLASSFWVECGGETRLDSLSSTELLPEATCKLHSTIQDNGVRKPIELPNMLQEYVC
jgi:hypothetical protein